MVVSCKAWLKVYIHCSNNNDVDDDLVDSDTLLNLAVTVVILLFWVLY